jgi:hypothetical protein
VRDYYGSNGSSVIDKNHRDSLTAFLKLPSKPSRNSEDLVVNCVEQRAADFQGYVPVENLENLQVVKCYRFKMEY